MKVSVLLIVLLGFARCVYASENRKRRAESPTEEFEKKNCGKSSVEVKPSFTRDIEEIQREADRVTAASLAATRRARCADPDMLDLKHEIAIELNALRTSYSRTGSRVGIKKKSCCVIS